MPKAPSTRTSKARRVEPLGKQLERDEMRRFASAKKGSKGSRAASRGAGKPSRDPSLTDSRDSKRILKLAREQMDEEERQHARPKSLPSAAAFRDSEESEAESAAEENEEEYLERDQLAELGLTEADERALDLFMSAQNSQRRTLGDIIMQKMKEKEDARAALDAAQELPGISPQMVEVYTSVGKILSRYRAGKVPKAFKIIPALKNWEDVLFLTDPDSWSPQATLVSWSYCFICGVSWCAVA